MTKTATRQDVYSRVTDRIIEGLAQGVRPWLKPWAAGHTADRITAPLRHNGTPYRGMNVLLLWGEAMDKGYGSAIWMTYKPVRPARPPAMRRRKTSSSCHRPRLSATPRATPRPRPMS